jgi:hypothetical protein
MSLEPSSRRSSPRASNKVKQADKPLGPYGLAIELLEISRTAWFSIASQFHALFIPSVEGNHVSVTTDLCCIYFLFDRFQRRGHERC